MKAAPTSAQLLSACDVRCATTRLMTDVTSQPSIHYLAYVADYQPVAEHAPFAVDKNEMHMLTNEERIAVSTK